MTSKRLVINILFGACSLIGIVIAGANLPAGFKPIETTITIEIDGMDFGRVDHVSGLDNLYAGTTQGPFSRVKVSRDFVTDPSLYLWAKQTSRQRQELKDVHLITRNAYGIELRRDVLRLCQPLAWTVEVADPSLGGFHEAIELAVQDIARQ